MTGLLIAHELMCIVLLWGVFCRFTKASYQVLASVRLSFWLLGICACISIVAPLVWGYAPSLPVVMLEGAFAIVQTVTAAHWRDGPPYKFLKLRYRRERRTSHFMKLGMK